MGCGLSFETVLKAAKSQQKRTSAKSHESGEENKGYRV